METCLLCLCPEPDGIQSDGSKRVYCSEGNKFVCSKCTRIIVSSTPEQLKAALEKSIVLGMDGKSAFLINLIEEEEDEREERGERSDGESTIKRNMDRKRVVRKIKPTHR